MHLAWLLSGPLPLGNESNDLKILLLSFVAMDGGNNGVDRDRESRSGEIAGSLPLTRSIAKAGRLEETAPSPLVRDRAPIQTDSGSGYRVKSLFMAPAGWLNRTHCHGVQREGALQLVYQQKSSRPILC